MPDYQNKPCEGTCERLGQPCKRAEHYTKQADRFSAKPKQFNSTFKYNTPAEVTWYFWGLGIPEKKEGLVFAEMATCSPELVDEHGVIWPYWLKEFPCYLDCPITICSYCGEQHLKDLVREGYCLYDVHVEKPKPKKKKGTYYAKTWKQIQEDAKAYDDKQTAKQTALTKTEVDENVVAATLAMLSPEARKELQEQIEGFGNTESPTINEMKNRLSAGDEEE
jgi:hypothetical protein